MINTSNWREFKIGDIFKLKKGLCSNAPELSDGNEVPYIGAKKKENGVMKWVKRDEELISKKNCIAFISQGAGSNGYNNYYEIDTIQSTSNVLGYNENLNKYTGSFIVAVLDLERFRWSFGRGRAPKLKDTVILLPANGESPDWKFMEEFMKDIKRDLSNKIDNIIGKE